MTLILIYKSLFYLSLIVGLIFFSFKFKNIFNLNAHPGKRRIHKKKIPLLVSMGRLIPDKDFLTMIKAVHATLKVKKIQLLIMGKGIQKKILNFEIKKNKLNNKPTR